MLSKRFPVARQQILNNVAIVLQQWNRGVFYVGPAEVLYVRDKVISVQFISQRESMRRGLEPRAE
jgi:hypothetical protein